MLSAYFILFFNAFGAATILPIPSEITFVALIQSGYPAVAVFIVALLGNVLGACVNWLLGKLVYAKYQHRRAEKRNKRRYLHFFLPDQKQFRRAEVIFQKYGKWSLLFSWLPIIGDVFTILAGLMRLGFAWFLPLVLVGKATRYGVVLWLAYQVSI